MDNMFFNIKHFAICLLCTFILVSCGGNLTKEEKSVATKEKTDENFRNALRENLSDIAATNEIAEQDLKRAEEKAEQESIKQMELETKTSLIGDWVYRGTLNGYSIKSKLSFSESTMEWYINGEISYRGRWDVSWDKNAQEWLILYNPVSSTNWNDVFTYDPLRGIEFGEGEYYQKSNRQANNGRSSSYSSDYTFRSEQDVYSYLSSRRFRAGNLTVSFGNGGTVMYANGNQISNAMVVRDFDSRIAILAYTSPISPGWHTIRVNNTAGTLTDGDGHVYYSR